MMIWNTPAGTLHRNNVEIYFRTMSQPNFNYISTLFQRQMPAGTALDSQIMLIWTYCICLFVEVFTAMVILGQCLLVAGVPLTTFYSAATRECHAAGMRHGSPPWHVIQPQGQPVAVFSVKDESQAICHNYLFLKSLKSDQMRSSPHSPPTWWHLDHCATAVA